MRITQNAEVFACACKNLRTQKRNHAVLPYAAEHRCSHAPTNRWHGVNPTVASGQNGKRAFSSRPRPVLSAPDPLADVPGCLPECNFDYQTSIIPQGLSRVNRLRAEQGLLLPDGVGTVTLQIVAQTMANTPYYREEDPVELVYDEVPVQSVLGSGT